MSASVDTVLNELVTLFTAADGPNVTVIDSGPPIDPPLDWLCVGYDRTGQPGVMVTCGDDKSPATRDRESYDISCLLDFWTGSDNPANLRAAILTAFKIYRDALRANRTLSHSVTDAAVVEYELEQGVSPVGNVAALRFTVRVDAF